MTKDEIFSKSVRTDFHHIDFNDVEIYLGKPALPIRVELDENPHGRIMYLTDALGQRLSNGVQPTLYMEYLYAEVLRLRNTIEQQHKIIHHLRETIHDKD